MNLFHAYELDYMIGNMGEPEWVRRYHVTENGVWYFEKFTNFNGPNGCPSFLISPDEETDVDVRWKCEDYVNRRS